MTQEPPPPNPSSPLLPPPPAPVGNPALPAEANDQDGDSRPVFFFDIDNCLYPRSYKIHDMMGVLIHKYFVNHLEISESDATALHQRYYTEYGLALTGLVLHHTIDVMEYNRLVDDSLPLERVLQPSPSLTHLLTTLRASQTCSKLWLFTNAYIMHARRVVKLLGIDHLFDGVTYCDYAEGAKVGKLVCKPDREMFEQAMTDAGLCVGRDENRCYFVDDSALNCAAAEAAGWAKVALLVEQGEELPSRLPCRHVIRDLGQLRDVFPELWVGEYGTRDEVGNEPLRECSPTPGKEKEEEEGRLVRAQGGAWIQG